MLNLFKSPFQDLGTTLPELILACCENAPKIQFIVMILGLVDTTNMTKEMSRVGNYLNFILLIIFADPWL